MHSLRRNVNLAMLALFALALQFALSFGHAHHHAGLTEHSLAKVASASDQVASAPADDDDDDAHCAICASISLIGATALVSPANLALPGFVKFTAFNCEAAIVETTRRLSPFQPRAPPLCVSYI